MRRTPSLRLRRLLLVARTGLWLVFVLVCAEAVLCFQRWQDNRAFPTATATLMNPFIAAGTLSSAEELWADKTKKRYKANAAIRFPVGNTEYVVHTNSHGWRTPEFVIEKPAGFFRIVCIGASTTFDGPTNDRTYPALVAEELRRRHPQTQLEVLNLGISGWSSGDWLGEIDYLLRLQPDIIVQYNGANDICWNHMGDYRRQHRWRYLLNHSLLAQRLLPLPGEALDESLARSMICFRQFAKTCEEAGIVYACVSFSGPSYQQADSEMRSVLDVGTHRWYGFQLGLKYYRGYERILLRFYEMWQETVSNTDGIVAIDAHARLRDPNLFVDICHLTPSGTEQLARIVADGLSPVLKETTSK